MSEFDRVLGYERIDGSEVPGTGPITAVLAWRGQVFAARSGCVWVQTADGWTLADGENMPPELMAR